MSIELRLFDFKRLFETAVSGFPHGTTVLISPPAGRGRTVLVIPCLVDDDKRGGQ
jgi:hypothetical protein